MPEHKPEAIFLAFNEFWVDKSQFPGWSNLVYFVLNKFINPVMWNVVFILLEQFLMESEVVVIFLVLPIFHHC